MKNEFHLRPYQCRSIDAIVKNPHTAVFIDMALGKTIIALTAIADIKVKAPKFKWLVVAPIKVCETVWRQEAKEWEHTRHLKFSLVRGDVRHRALALHREADVYLINPEMLKWLHEHLREEWNMFDGLIIDESSLFKSHKAKRFKTLTNYGTRKAERDLITGEVMRDRMGHIIPIPPHKFKRTVIMTGTPRPQSMMNLWSQVYILDHGKRLHKKFDTFRTRYFIPTHKITEHQYKWEEKKEGEKENPQDYQPQEGAFDLIHQKIADMTVELSASEYGMLPKIIPAYHMVHLPDDLMKRYKKLEADALIELEQHTIIAVNGGAKTNMCWQFANGAMYTGLGTSAKQDYEIIHDLLLDELDDLVEQLDRNVLITYNFISDRERILKRHPDAVVLPRKAEAVVERWNAGNIRKLLLHPKSGSHGLNIQFGGSDVIWFGSLWSNEQYRQTNRRLARPGQPCGEGVTSHHIQVAKTIHELQHAAVLMNGGLEDNFRAALRNYQKANRLGIYVHELL